MNDRIETGEEGENGEQGEARTGVSEWQQMDTSVTPSVRGREPVVVVMCFSSSNLFTLSRTTDAGSGSCVLFERLNCQR